MKLAGIFIALTLALTGVANAEIKEKGGYIGGSLGYGGYKDGNFDGYAKDRDAVYYGIYGGYKFMKYFALEGRITNMGEYDLQEPGDGPESKIRYDALTINGVGILPLGSSNWELMGQLGIGNGRYKVTGEEYADGNETIYSIGAGVRWTPTPGFTTQFSLDGYKIRLREGTLPEESFSTKLGEARLAFQWNF